MSNQPETPDHTPPSRPAKSALQGMTNMHKHVLAPMQNNTTLGDRAHVS